MTKCPLCLGSRLSSRTTPSSRTYFDCADCGLISLDPELRLSPNAERTRYELHQNSPSDSAYRNFLNLAISPLLPHLSPGMKGLDYGCGPGPTASVMLGELGYHVENYDPFFFPRTFSKDDRFNFIIATESVEHFYNPAEEFDRISSLLSSEGWLSVMTRVFDTSCNFNSWWYLRDPTHVSIYADKTFDWLAVRYGWSLERPHRNVRLFRKL